LRVEQGEGAFAGGARLDDLILQLREVFQGLIHEKNTADQLQEHRGIGVAGRQINQIRQQQSHAAGTEKFNERAGKAAGADDAHILADVPARGVLKLVGHNGFQVVGFDNAVSGEGFGHGLRQFGGSATGLRGWTGGFCG
jgi:hypothetical protein